VIPTALGEGLAVVGADGRVVVWHGSRDENQAAPGLAETPLPGPQLPQPDRSLVAFGRLEGETGPVSLLVADPDGTRMFAPSRDGGFELEAERLARRARFSLFTGRPLRTPLLADLNADQRADLTLPGSREVTLYWNRAGEDGARSFERGGEIRVPSSLLNDFETDDLTDRLRSTIVVPRLETEDLNGDGRLDLIVQERKQIGFHLQVEDLGFPPDPDVRLDLSVFRDDASGSNDFAPGGAVELNLAASVERRDLDGDGIPDHVVFQGRKLWAFLSDAEGPQFTEPSMILKSSEPITGTLFLDVDGDELGELVLLRVEVPTIPSLILGLFSEWDIPIHVNAYRNVGAGRFETRPFRSRELRLRLPPILGLVRDPYAIVERFTQASQRFRSSESADLDGDGNLDLLLLDEERTTIEVYRGRGAEGAVEMSTEQLEALAREQLFVSDEAVWDTERLIGLIGNLADNRVRRLTENESPAERLTFDFSNGLRLSEVLPIDVDGDGKREVVVVFARDNRPGWRRFELIAPLR
jgi:hypothetical protein